MPPAITARWTLILIVLGLAGCASTGAARQGPDPVGQAISQPFRDLSLIRERLPEPLVRALSEPYRAPADCGEIRRELAELDAALGPDVDAPPGRQDDGGRLVSEAIRSAAGLPFRGAVRELTGAARRDRALAHAVLAGTARRGFLKGLLRHCAVTDTVQTPARPG